MQAIDYVTRGFVLKKKNDFFIKTIKYFIISFIPLHWSYFLSKIRITPYSFKKP